MTFQNPTYAVSLGVSGACVEAIACSLQYGFLAVAIGPEVHIAHKLSLGQSPSTISLVYTNGAYQKPLR
jgi:hypothetical protein